MADNAIAIKLKINGKECTGQKGQTVLDVCKASGVHVPTLCHCEGLKPVGGCRLCIVEIEGQRRLNTACTTPATDGMVVQTETPRLQDLRKRTLELLFSERNHICPFCPASGDCELQKAGYDHGITHVRYDYLLPRLPIDNSHPYIAQDHSRCILCSRCVRVCDEWVGRHTLDLAARGSMTLVAADAGAPLGKSSLRLVRHVRRGVPDGAAVRQAEQPDDGPAGTARAADGVHGVRPGLLDEGQDPRPHRAADRLGHGPAGNPIICNRGRYDAPEAGESARPADAAAEEGG